MNCAVCFCADKTYADIQEWHDDTNWLAVSRRSEISQNIESKDKFVGVERSNRSAMCAEEWKESEEERVATEEEDESNREINIPEGVGGNWERRVSAEKVDEEQFWSKSKEDMLVWIHAQNYSDDERAIERS